LINWRNGTERAGLPGEYVRRKAGYMGYIKVKMPADPLPPEPERFLKKKSRIRIGLPEECISGRAGLPEECISGRAGLPEECISGRAGLPEECISGRSGYVRNASVDGLGYLRND
jgi:hypothetical protein